VPGERAESEKGSKKNGIGKGPLEYHLGDLKEEVLEYQVERGLVFDEEIHLLEEEDNYIDKDQAAQA
jgi:hypothetical protein